MSSIGLKDRQTVFLHLFQIYNFQILDLMQIQSVKISYIQFSLRATSVSMQERKIYKTLRIRFKDEMKLFPSWKIQGIDHLKQKVIARFDMSMKRDDFDLNYRDEKTNEVLVLQNDKNSDMIDTKLIQQLTSNKIELLVREKQKYLKKLFQEEKRQNKAQALKPVTKNHKHYAQCDDCMQFPILGARYKCLLCKNYDLCQLCYVKLEKKSQQKGHPYIKIRQPIQKIQSIEVAFDDNDLKIMNLYCQKSTEEEKDTNNEKMKEVDHDSLPQKYVSGRNFVQEMFNQQCSKRRNQHSLDFKNGQVLISTLGTDQLNIQND